MAKIYEQQEEFKLASTFYAEASKTTMSNLQITNFTKKAKELSEKAEAQ